MRDCCSRRASRIVVLFALALVAGCSGRTALEGSVTVDGKPVHEGSISFEPLDGEGPSAGGTIKDGKFQFMPPGEFRSGMKRVRIRAAFKTGRQVPAGPPRTPDVLIDEMIYYPPSGATEEYREAQVETGKRNDFRFELKSPAVAKP